MDRNLVHIVDKVDMEVAYTIEMWDSHSMDIQNIVFDMMDVRDVPYSLFDKVHQLEIHYSKRDLQECYSALGDKMVRVEVQFEERVEVQVEVEYTVLNTAGGWFPCTNLYTIDFLYPSYTALRM